MPARYRGRGLLVASGFLLLPLPMTLAQPEAGPPRPNLVIILCDNLGYGDISGRHPRLPRLPFNEVCSLL